MGANFRTTLTYSVGSGNVQERLVGTGDTAAHALAELTAKAKVMSGVPIKAVSTADQDITGITFKDTGEFKNAVLTVSRGATFPSHVIRIRNMAYPDYLVANDISGKLDITNADLIALAAAFVDNDGLNGYTPVGGQYI